ncbi:14717_t:CDS:2, partial [Racocetra fulgida]
SVDHVLKQANQIVQFFKKSHRANRLLHDSIKNMNLEGGGLETYCETRWASIFGTTSSIVRLKPVFDKIHSYYISNLKNELKFYGKELSESELRESVLNQTTYAEIENTNMLEQNEDVLMSFQLSNHEKLEIGSVVNLSDTNFGGQGDNEE